MSQFDEWIIGEGLTPPGHFYVTHMREPRFIAKVCADDEMELAGGITWSLGDQGTVCAVEFYDEPPTGKDLDKLMLGLREVLDDYDVRVDRRNARSERCDDEWGEL